MTVDMVADAVKQQFPGWPHYEEDEIAAVDRVLRSGRVNYWTGTEARTFEEEYAASLNLPHCVSLANGTVALDIALAVLGIGPGDDVVTTPRTYIASAGCAMMRGARIVFADVDRDSQNITADTIERVLTARTRAIICVHLAGWPCEMGPIVELASVRKIAVIEDCAQANGARYRDMPVGTFGTFGTFSFCQDKIITTGGEGGLLAARDDENWRRAWALKDHGKDYVAATRKDHPPGFRWVHHSFGGNGRMTEMQAAIGRIQLRKLAVRVDKRRNNSARLRKGLADLQALRVPEPGPDIYHAYYRFYAFLAPGCLKPGWTRQRVIATISEHGVPCFEGSCPEVYLERAFDRTDSRPTERLPVARELGESSLAFLVHPTLEAEHMDRTCEVVRDVLRAAVR